MHTIIKIESPPLPSPHNEQLNRMLRSGVTTRSQTSMEEPAPPVPPTEPPEPTEPPVPPNPSTSNINLVVRNAWISTSAEAGFGSKASFNVSMTQDSIDKLVACVDKALTSIDKNVDKAISQFTLILHLLILLCLLTMFTITLVVVFRQSVSKNDLELNFINMVAAGMMLWMVSMITWIIYKITTN